MKPHRWKCLGQAPGTSRERMNVHFQWVCKRCGITANTRSEGHRPKKLAGVLKDCNEVLVHGVMES